MSNDQCPTKSQIPMTKTTTRSRPSPDSFPCVGHWALGFHWSLRIWSLVILAFAACPLVAQGPSSASAPAADPSAISLNGPWEYTAFGADKSVPVRIPGYGGSKARGQYERDYKAKGGTFRRTFTMPEGVTGAVIEFDAIRWGGSVSVNGQLAGTYDLGFSPFVLDVSKFVKPGPNTLEVRLVSWTELPQYPTGDAVIPTAAGNWWGNKLAGIPGDVTLRPYNKARIGWVRITPHAKGPSCDVEAEVFAAEDFHGTVAAGVMKEDGKTMMSKEAMVSKEVHEPVELKAGTSTIVRFRDIQAPKAELWFPDSPVMYRMIVAVLDGERHIDFQDSLRQEKFGFREIGRRDGLLTINGRPTPLFGFSNGWVWSDFTRIDNDAALKRYSVEYFRLMNGTAFRSHQDPMVRKWLDLCDRNGILVVAEMPNFPDVQRLPLWSMLSPYQRPDFWERLQREMRGIVALRFNHPCIVAWSATNEGNGFGDWERANLEPFARKLDPTRPVMFSSDFTDDFADSHNFLGNWYGSAGEFERSVLDLRKHAGDRVVACTEFGQYSGGNLFTGMRKVTPEQVDLDRAQLLMEQIEAMRRARYGAIQPYCYPADMAANSGKVEDLPPSFHAMRHAFSPMGLSIALTRQHAAAGQKVKFNLAVCADTDAAASRVVVDLMLTDRRPPFDWNGDETAVKVLSRQDVAFDVKCWETTLRPVEVAMPDKAGQYCLVARVKRGMGVSPAETTVGRGQDALGTQGRDALATCSFRPITVFDPLPAPAKKLAVGVIALDDRLEKWLVARGHEVVLPYGGRKPDVIVVDEGQLNNGRLRLYGFNMAARVRAGTRLVVLEQPCWNAAGFEGKLLQGLASAPLRVKCEPVHPLPEFEAFVGADEDFRRLNGCDNVGLSVRLELPKAAEAAKTLGTGQPDDVGASASRPTSATAPTTVPASPWRPMIVAYNHGEKDPDWAVAHRFIDNGEIFACQVPLGTRLDRNSDDYDPVAERLLAAMIEKELPKE